MATKTLSRHKINQLNRDELRAELDAAHQMIRDFEAQDQPLRDVLVELSQRAVDHRAAGRTVQAAEANECANVIESRMKGDYWYEVDELIRCQKDDDTQNL